MNASWWPDPICTSATSSKPASMGAPDRGVAIGVVGQRDLSYLGLPPAAGVLEHVDPLGPRLDRHHRPPASAE
jgi:hypothetical protein